MEITHRSKIKPETVEKNSSTIDFKPWLVWVADTTQQMYQRIDSLPRRGSTRMH